MIPGLFTNRQKRSASGEDARKKAFKAFCLLFILSGLGFSAFLFAQEPASGAIPLSPVEVPIEILDETASDVLKLAPDSGGRPEILPSFSLDLATGEESLGTPTRAVASPSFENMPRKFWNPMLPVLMVGKMDMKRSEDEASQSVTIDGYLLVEEHRIKGRKFYRRWVLEDKDQKIPLASNFSLMEALAQPNILDSLVRARGRWVFAAGASETRFFSVEKLISLDGVGETASPANFLGMPGSFPVNLGSGSFHPGSGSFPMEASASFGVASPTEFPGSQTPDLVSSETLDPNEQPLSVPE